MALPAARFDIYRADGRSMGAIVAPSDVRIAAVNGTTVIGFRVGSLDEITVVGYRLDVPEWARVYKCIHFGSLTHVLRHLTAHFTQRGAPRRLPRGL